MSDFRPKQLAVAICLLVASAPGEAAVKKMFVTSAVGKGNLGGWPEAMGQTGPAAGNRICRTLAAAAGLDNAGTFRAWLSTPATDAYCRIAGYPGERSSNCGEAQLPDAGPWVRVDGAPFATSLQALTDTDSYAALHAPALDENGADVGSHYIFTGTNGDGRENGNDCNAWQSASNSIFGMSGSTTSTHRRWTRIGVHTCFDELHLLCFEPGAGDPLADYELPGAYAFVTSASGSGELGTWGAAGTATGLAAGDSICRNLADAAGLPQPSSFVAWLSTTSVAALDRLPPSTPFKRVDGIQIVPDKSALVIAGPSDRLDAPLNVTQTGSYVGSMVFTGTPQAGGTSDRHCDDWMSDQDLALSGFAEDTTGQWTTFGVPSCASEQRIYCFSSLVTIFRDDFELGDASRWANF